MSNSNDIDKIKKAKSLGCKLRATANVSDFHNRQKVYTVDFMPLLDNSWRISMHAACESEIVGFAGPKLLSSLLYCAFLARCKYKGVEHESLRTTDYGSKSVVNIVSSIVTMVGAGTSCLDYAHPAAIVASSVIMIGIDIMSYYKQKEVIDDELTTKVESINDAYDKVKDAFLKKHIEKDVHDLPSTSHARCEWEKALGERKNCFKASDVSAVSAPDLTLDANNLLSIKVSRKNIFNGSNKIIQKHLKELNQVESHLSSIRSELCDLHSLVISSDSDVDMSEKIEKLTNIIQVGELYQKKLVRNIEIEKNKICQDLAESRDQTFLSLSRDTKCKIASSAIKLAVGVGFLIVASAAVSPPGLLVTTGVCAGAAGLALCVKGAIYYDDRKKRNRTKRRNLNNSARDPVLTESDSKSVASGGESKKKWKRFPNCKTKSAKPNQCHSNTKADSKSVSGHKKFRSQKWRKGNYRGSRSKEKVEIEIPNISTPSNK